MTKRWVRIDRSVITRVEVIDRTGRVYVHDPRTKVEDFVIDIEPQDNGKTLKIFIFPKNHN